MCVEEVPSTAQTDAEDNYTRSVDTDPQIEFYR